MSRKDSVKKEFPTLEDLMYRNKTAIERHKRYKHFEIVKPFKKYKKGVKII